MAGMAVISIFLVFTSAISQLGVGATYFRMSNVVVIMLFEAVTAETFMP